MVSQEQDGDLPRQQLIISDLATLKVVSDDLRLRVIQALREEPHTVKNLAGMLGVPQKGLYYHVGLLEQHGLIRVVRTRMVRGITEKWYRATAHLIRLDDAILAEPSPAREEGLAALVTTALNQTRDDIVSRVQAGLLDVAPSTPRHQRLLSTWILGDLPDEQADEFYSRLDALLRDFPVLPDQDPIDSDGRRYRLVLAFYPVSGRLLSADPESATAGHELRPEEEVDG